MKRQKTRWFKAKSYGWGWTPITWQGWVLTLGFSVAYALLSILCMGWLAANTQAGGTGFRGLVLGLLEFVAAFTLLTTLLIHICSRFGEEPRWRWGKQS